MSEERWKGPIVIRRRISKSTLRSFQNVNSFYYFQLSGREPLVLEKDNMDTMRISHTNTRELFSTVDSAIPLIR